MCGSPDCGTAQCHSCTCPFVTAAQYEWTWPLFRPCPSLLTPLGPGWADTVSKLCTLETLLAHSARSVVPPSPPPATAALENCVLIKCNIIINAFGSSYLFEFASNIALVLEKLALRIRWHLLQGTHCSCKDFFFLALNAFLRALAYSKTPKIRQNWWKPQRI